MTAEEAFRLFEAAPREQKIAVGSLLWDAIAETDDLNFTEARRFTELITNANKRIEKLLAEDDR